MRTPTMEGEVPAGVLSPEDEETFLARFNPDLPAFGCDYSDPSNHGQALAYLYRIARESGEAREPYIHQAQENGAFYNWGHPYQPADDQIIVNDIQTTVLSITDIQTREPFAIFIRPVETRDRSPSYWIGPAVDQRVAAMIPELAMFIGLGTTAVIDPTTQQPAMQQMQDPATGMVVGQQPMMRSVDPETDQLQPLDDLVAWKLRKIATSGAFPSEWLVKMDDRLVADVYQTVFDDQWKDAEVDDFILENLLNANVFGYQTAYYGWDEKNKCHIIKPISIKQVFLDPEQPTLELANYFMFDIEMDVDRAKAEYPQLSPLIEQYGKIGTPSRVDSMSDFGVGSDRNFYRRTVTFRIAWFRNQTVPMTPEEAQESGLVVASQDPMTGESVYNLAHEEVAQTSMEGDQSTPNTEQASSQGIIDYQGDAQSNGSSPAMVPQTSSPAQPNPPLGGTSSAAQQGSNLGATASPAPAAWPTTTGIRQIATIAQCGRIVQDIRCEHWDIPALLIKCIAIPGQPFAQGLPQKLRGLQQADTTILQSEVEYVKTYAHPGCMIPQSVETEMKKGLKRTHIDPTETIVVPDHIYERWGDKSVTWFVPPALPPAVPVVQAQIRDRQQSTSGHPEVMQGQAPSATSSGRLVEALQAGAAGQFGFQARWTASAVQRLANLMHYSHLWRMTIDDIGKIYSWLPRQLLAMVVDKAQRGRWDVQVDANNGASGETDKRLRRSISLFNLANPKTGENVLPLRMMRDAANIDHEEATIAWREELQDSIPMMPPGMAPPGQPQEQGPPPASDAQGSAQQPSF